MILPSVTSPTETPFSVITPACAKLTHKTSQYNGSPICLSQGFYSCTNIMTKKQVREERVYSAYTSALQFITKGSQDWNSSRVGSRS